MQPNNPPQPQPNPVVAPTPPTGSGNKMVWSLVGGLVVIILVVAAIYFYLGQQKGLPPATPTPKPQAEAGLDSLENEVSALIIEDIEGDFQSIDQDLNSL